MRVPLIPAYMLTTGPRKNEKMNTVSTQKNKRESENSEFSMSQSTRAVIGYVALLLMASALSDDLGPFGAMGGALCFAAGIYGTSFFAFKRRSTDSLRHPLPDSTRLYVSVVALLALSADFSDDLGFLKAIAVAFLFAAGIYAMSFLFCQRKITHSFRIPISDWVRVLVSGLLAASVSSDLTVNLGLFGELGILAIFCVGTYMMSFLFFSKKGDTPQVEADVAGASES